MAGKSGYPAITGANLRKLKKLNRQWKRQQHHKLFQVQSAKHDIDLMAAEAFLQMRKERGQ